jgi:hypothetical protein
VNGPTEGPIRFNHWMGCGCRMCHERPRSRDEAGRLPGDYQGNYLNDSRAVLEAGFAALRREWEQENKSLRFALQEIVEIVEANGRRASPLRLRAIAIAALDLRDVLPLPPDEEDEGARGDAMPYDQDADRG